MAETEAPKKAKPIVAGLAGLLIGGAGVSLVGPITVNTGDAVAVACRCGKKCQCNHAAEKAE